MMQSSPIESAPGKQCEQREIHWGFENIADMQRSLPRRWQRFAIHAALFVTVGLAVTFVPWDLNDWARGWDSFSGAGNTPVAVQPGSQVAAISPDSVIIKLQLAAEQERQRSEVLANQLALARESIGTLTARVTALTDARTEAEKALQTAEASIAEQKLVLEQERERGEKALRTAAASATEQKLALERERERGEKALRTAEASVAEQKLALEQERERGDTLLRELASARELIAKDVQNGIAVSCIETGQAGEVTNASLKVGSVSPSTTQSVLVKRAAPESRESASAPQRTTDDSVGKGNSATAAAQEPQNAALGDPTQVAASPPLAVGEHQIALWVKRGQEFIADGDFVSARLVIQRAAETGNANAAFMLAGTYDPNVLDLIRARGLAPDIAKARLWYEKAKNLGSPEAARRLELLIQQTR